MNIIETALQLLSIVSLALSEYPATIESIEVCAHDVADHINKLSDIAGCHEETASRDASAESSESKRKTRRAELLRADEVYQETQAQIRDAERVRVQLVERSARLRREYRYGLLQLELSALKIRA